MFTIIVNSSDNYDDCWHPFFFLLNKYFENINEFEIILNTNSKKFEYPGLHINCYNFLDKANIESFPWAKRLILNLEKAKNDVILILFDDYFIKSKVDSIKLMKMTDLMLTNPEIKHIRFTNGPWNKKEYKNLELFKINQFTKYRFCLQPGLWDKKALIRILRDHENAWQSEIWGTVRSFFVKDLYLCFSDNFFKENIPIINCPSAGVIRKGKWIKNEIQEILDNEDLDIDLLKRGFEKPDNFYFTWKRKFLFIFRSPHSSIKSFISIFLSIISTIKR
jgi:hypothetical protein